jgi:hypothetical protein
MNLQANMWLQSNGKSQILFKPFFGSQTISALMTLMHKFFEYWVNCEIFTDNYNT